MPSTTALAGVRAKIAEFPGDPYLLTVTAKHRPHCGTVTPEWDSDGTRILVPAPSSWPGSETAGLSQVSLLWPPATAGGYSLIIDGVAEPVRDDHAMLAVTPTRAVLHRRGPAPAQPASSCGSDCVPLLSR